MSLTEFDRGYWFTTDLKQFAKALGIPLASRLRKDELERAITAFLRSGTIAPLPARHPVTPVRGHQRDSDLGLRLDRRIVRYTNDHATKAFLEREARKIAPDFRQRSGAMYRLNRWREKQVSRGIALTYRALVAEYVRLTLSPKRFAQVPHGRYINFISDFMAHETRPTMPKALAAWRELKSSDCVKTYRAWTRIR